MSNSANKTYYDVLQVKPSATPEEITATYRKLARHYHPDHNDAPDATRVMQIINEAYDVLNDPQKREAYERFLKEGVPMDRGHRTTQIFMHVLRQGAPVGLFRKMSIIFDGRNIGQISWSKQRNFIISSVRLVSGSALSVAQTRLWVQSWHRCLRQRMSIISRS